MDFDSDPGVYIALIAVASGSVILVMSYLGAYMLGRGHGRRAERQSTPVNDHADAYQRIAAVEVALHGIGRSVERLMDAQRLLVAQQDHLSRKVGATDRNPAFPVAKTTNTPS
jgi:ABC-type protease/lipase transport system fused ATPase/permease subunit